VTGWAAPTASRAVRAEVRVPGSKSATARALVLSALADGPGTITGGLRARDSSLMIAGLRALGAGIDDHGPLWRVDPLGSTPAAGASIDCGLAGTVMRFLPPLAALGSGPTAFSGDPAASARPMGPLLDALRQLGAGVVGAGLPLTVTGPVRRRDVVIDASASSQFISALLLAAPRFPAGVRLTHVGGPVPSLPHIEMTVAALAARGVAVGGDQRTWAVAAGPIAAAADVIEPDLTTAAVFLGAALVTGGTVTVPGWPATTHQPGAGVPAILTRLGGTSSLGAAGLTLTGTGHLTGLDIDLHAVSELTPVVAALAALADSPSVIRGVGHIRGHETNRLAALASEITGLGGDCRETADGLAIRPARLTGGVFHTCGDHRLAHAAALIGLVVDGVHLDDVSCTSKTMPEFAATWAGLVR
jgi:3-phosphoshikimate 1-carboxyvinyltransferase